MRTRERKFTIALVFCFLASVCDTVVLPHQLDSLGRVYSLKNGDSVRCPLHISHDRTEMYPIIDGTPCVAQMMIRTDAEATTEFKKVVDDDGLVQLKLPRFAEADNYIAVSHHNARLCGVYKFDSKTIHLFSKFGNTRTLAIASKSRICTYAEKANDEQMYSNRFKKGFNWIINKLSRQQASQSPMPSLAPLPAIEMSAVPIPSAGTNTSGNLVPVVVPFFVSPTPSQSQNRTGTGSNTGNSATTTGTGNASGNSTATSSSNSTNSNATGSTPTVTSNSTVNPTVVNIGTVQQNLQNVQISPIPGFSNFPILVISVAPNRATLIPSPSQTPTPSNSKILLSVQNGGSSSTSSGSQTTGTSRSTVTSPSPLLSVPLPPGSNGSGLPPSSSAVTTRVPISATPAPRGVVGLPNLPQFTTFPAISIKLGARATLTVIDPSTAIQAGILSSQSASPVIVPISSSTARPSASGTKQGGTRPNTSPLVFSRIPLAVGPSAPASTSSGVSKPTPTHTARPKIATMSPSRQPQPSASRIARPSNAASPAVAANNPPLASTSRTPRPSMVITVINATPSPTNTHTARPRAAVSPSKSGIAIQAALSNPPVIIIPTTTSTKAPAPNNAPAAQPTPTQTFTARPSLPSRQASAPVSTKNSATGAVQPSQAPKVVTTSTATNAPVKAIPVASQTSRPIAIPQTSRVVAIPIASQTARPIAIPQSSKSPSKRPTGPAPTGSHTPIHIRNQNVRPTSTHTPRPSRLIVEMSKSPVPTGAIPTKSHTPPPTVLPAVFFRTARPTLTHTPAPSLRPAVLKPPMTGFPNGSSIPTQSYTPAPSKFSTDLSKPSPVAAIPQSSRSPVPTGRNNDLGIAQDRSPSPTPSSSASMSTSIGPTPGKTKSASASDGGTTGGGGGGGGGKASVSSTPSASISISPTPSPGTGTPSGGSVCFPGSAHATLADGKQIRLDDLFIGARVLTANGRYSEVYGFSHATDELYQFVTLETARGTLTLTEGHHVYTETGIFAARDVYPGHKLLLGQGGSAQVERVGSTVQRGLYNPHTVSGTVVVDGFVTSTYTEHVNHRMAQAALSPFRALYACGARFDALAGILEKGLYDAAQTWMF